MYQNDGCNVAINSGYFQSGQKWHKKLNGWENLTLSTLFEPFRAGARRLDNTLALPHGGATLLSIHHAITCSPQLSRGGAVHLRVPWAWPGGDAEEWGQGAEGGPAEGGPGWQVGGGGDLSQTLARLGVLVARVHLASLACSGYRVVHITEQGTAARYTTLLFLSLSTSTTLLLIAAILLGPFLLFSCFSLGSLLSFACLLSRSTTHLLVHFFNCLVSL